MNKCVNEQLCHTILKSMHKCRSYGPYKFERTNNAHTPCWSCNSYVSLTASGIDKKGAWNVEASAQMKFASEARLRSNFPFGNTEPTCMPLSWHFIDIEGRVQVYQTERYQLTNEVCIRSLTKAVISFGNAEPTCFYATIWTLLGIGGEGGSGPSAPDRAIPTQPNL